MAFLDNSGDIILDAVLTDIGRKRLAAGNFVITKFALGDEEIKYGLWDSSESRGSACFELEIMLIDTLTNHSCTILHHCYMLFLLGHQGL